MDNDLLQILYCSYWEIQKRSDDELIKMRTKEFKVLYNIIDFMLHKFTENIYPETMLVDIFEYLLNNYNYDMWNGVIKEQFNQRKYIIGDESND